jgi:porin
LFVNATFGWPTQPSVDLPSGGPGYPLATPAIRVRVDPHEGVTLFLGLFNGDPTGAGVGGSQLRDASGTAFRTSDGAWLIGEIRYNPDDSDKNGTYRFGGWWNSERFRDLRLDQNGVSLARPVSNGKPLRHDGDPSVYVNIDQPLLVNDADNTRLAVFARAGIAPGDRNLIDLYIDGGITIQRFLEAGLIQRLIITRVPVLLGSGIPLFGPLSRDVRPRHVSTRSYPSGLVQSEYVIE